MLCWVDCGVHVMIMVLCSAMNERTGEHIADITERQNKIDELEAQVVHMTGQLLTRATNITDEEEEETVPKSKVMEMEALFMDAISRLSTRVNQLEESKAAPQPPKPSSPNVWLNDDTEFAAVKHTATKSYYGSSGNGGVSGTGVQQRGSGKSLNKITLNSNSNPRKGSSSLHSNSAALVGVGSGSGSGSGSSSGSGAAQGAGPGNRIEPGRIRPSKISI